MKQINKYEKKLDSLLEESVKKTSIKKRKRITEAFKPTDKQTMIMIGGDPDDSKKYYPWYLQKMGDSTHFQMANNEKALGTGAAMVSHVGQHRGEEYYDDVVKWLHGKLKSKDIFGKKYSGNG